jgi:CheY-like chemotaxis protein
MTTILLVADDPFITGLLREALSEDGHTTLTACSPSEALSILREHADIDLLFIDVRDPASLPNYALAQEAKRLQPTLSVLYATGAAIETKKGDPLPAHLGILKMPYTLAHVRTKVRAIIPS